MFNLKEIKSPDFYYNSLFYDFIFNFDKVRHHYCYDYRSIGEFERRADDINKFYDNDFRLKIVNILKSLNSRLCCGKRTLNNIELLKDRKTCVVIGGQQPGFLTGPVFIIYKILTIIKLSQYLSALLKCNVIPLFWNASDDSNFDQVNNFYLLNKKVKKINLALPEASGLKKSRRFSNIFVSEELIRQKIEEVKENLTPSTDFTENAIDMLDECLRVAGKSFYGEKTGLNPPNVLNLSSFFSAIILKLFSKYGLVVIDPSEPDLKALALKLIKFDIENYAGIYDAVKEAGENLKNEGYHSQIMSDVKNLNFFLDVEGKRRRFIEVKNGYFALPDCILDENELFEFLKSRVSQLSLNVVLRPIFQDTVLPVLAEVCGPGEISYYGQMKKVYEIFNLKTGIIYPRFSATIIESKIEKSIRKLGIDYEELGKDKSRIRKKIIAHIAGKDVEKLLKNFESDIFLKLSGLKKSLSFCPKNSGGTSSTGSYGTKESMESAGSIGSAFDRIERNFKKEIEVLGKKLYSEFEKRSDLISANLDKIYINIFPENKLQERIINVFNYINKYDFKLLDCIYDIVKPFDFYHEFLIIS
ncbi:MAG: bacillithiol biosynthesis cysteine-adding enzyme BshC [Actinobacteria bacterium]|nr:bacillithiol biosynthesis cysteine-adding enzyme BshC [Actinomycetota bacterium]